MTRFLVVLLLALPLAAEPRVFAPVFLKTGSVNELYVWDEDPVAPFQVEVRRDGKLLQTAAGFPVNRPLSVLGASNRPLKWAAALIVPDVLVAPGEVTLTFVRGKTVFAHAESEIRPRTFASEDIALDQAMSDLRSKPNTRRDREAAEIYKVYTTVDPKTLWTGPRFRLPVNARTTAQFGDIRQYKYADGGTAKDYHRGVDFGVPEGTPVSAAAAGTVSLASNRYLTGNTVVVEHAPGVYSVYFHLSKLVVKKGQKVAAGDRLGLSGATGLVTGPHLHWEIRVDGVPADPLDFVVDGLLDTDAVSGIISSID